MYRDWFFVAVVISAAAAIIPVGVIVAATTAAATTAAAATSFHQTLGLSRCLRYLLHRFLVAFKPPPLGVRWAKLSSD
jgi:hypothetical protein